MILRVKDDPTIERYLVEDYYNLHKIGLVYGSWEGKKAIVTILQYVIYCSILLCFIFLFFYTTYLSVGDIALFSQSLHVGIVCVVALVICIVTAFKRSDIIYIYKNLMEEMGEQKQDSFYHEVVRELHAERKVILLFWPLYYGFSAIVGFIIGPMLDIYLGRALDTAPHPMISLNLPVALWTPFDLENNTVLYGIMFILLVIMGILDAMIVSAGVVGTIVMNQRICLQIKLLIHSLETLDNRTMELYEMKEGITNIKNIDKKLYLKYFNQCLIESVKHHQSILRVYKTYGRLVELPIAVPFFAGAVLLAFAGIHIISDDVRLGPKILSGSLVLGEMLNMLMLCANGERLKQLSEDLRMAVYSINWFGKDRKCWSSVKIMQERTRVSMNIRCLYILEVNMDTFAKIINSAYSYFNLVIAFK